MLQTSVISETLSLTAYDDFLVVSKDWKISRAIDRVIGVAAYSSLNRSFMYGKLNVTIPERIIINKHITQYKSQFGFFFFPVEWKNDGNPVRLFYRNNVPQASFSPYEITVLLKVLYAR